MRLERVRTNWLKIFIGAFFCLMGIFMYRRGGEDGTEYGAISVWISAILIFHAIYCFIVERKEKELKTRKISWVIAQIFVWFIIAVFVLLLFWLIKNGFYQKTV